MESVRVGFSRLVELAKVAGSNRAVISLLLSRTSSTVLPVAIGPQPHPNFIEVSGQASFGDRPQGGGGSGGGWGG